MLRRRVPQRAGRHRRNRAIRLPTRPRAWQERGRRSKRQCECLTARRPRAHAQAQGESRDQLIGQAGKGSLRPVLLAVPTRRWNTKRC